MPNASAPLRRQPESLAERFWSIARGMDVRDVDPDRIDPVRVVRHVLAILDAVERGDTGEALSVTTLSFLKLLREHEIRGDLSYASPEQIRGETMDERSLVFSVGVLLFERLTGRHPFGAEGNNPRRFARIRKGEFGSGVNYFPTVPQSLRAVLMRAMGPFPEERFATLRELRVHLEQFCAGQKPAPRLPGTTRARPKPSTDSDPTRVVDMTQQARRERAFIHGRAVTEQAPAHLRPLDISAFDEADGVELQAPSPQPQPVEPVEERSGVIETESETPPLPAPIEEARLYVADLTKHSKMAPLLWAAGGAAIASIAFFLLRPGGGSEGAAGSVSPPAITASAPTRSDPTSKPATGSAVQDDRKREAAEPPRFDPKLGGEAIVAASKTCLSPARLRSGVRFGLGVVYPSDDTKRRKLFFAGDLLTIGERRCLHDALRRVSAGVAPERTQLVDYRIRVSARDHQVEHELN